MERAYLGLGANLGDPVAQIERAILRLPVPGALRVLARAGLYRTRPIGPAGQPDYLNTALEIETTLEPLLLLDRLKAIEGELGRTPGVRWGPRVIDLDILLYGDRELRSDRLVIPHAELARRRFALAPLSELAAERIVPGLGRTVKMLLEGLGDDPEAVTRLS
jgi:2-amino-4-hydroxy-6-hydroxymethyldihydropteridine diphosphokinase